MTVRSPIRRFTGTSEFRSVSFGACRETAIPVFALGGVGPHNAGEVMEAGAFGIALIKGVVAAPDPRGAAAELLTRIGKALAAGQAGGQAAKEGRS